MIKKIKKVQQLFTKLDEHISEFQKETGLHCISECNKCCLKENLEASVLEFLPLAFHIFLSNKADATFEQLESNTPHCIMLNHLKLDESETNSGCSNYQNRGLICRAFGFTTVKNKNESLALYTCRDIKTHHASKIEAIVPRLQKLNPPLLSYYYGLFASIDPNMSEDYNPINVSIHKALMKVCYYMEHKPHRPQKNIDVS